MATAGRHRLRLLRLLQNDSQRTVSPPSGISWSAARSTIHFTYATLIYILLSLVSFYKIYMRNNYNPNFTLVYRFSGLVVCVILLFVCCKKKYAHNTHNSCEKINCITEICKYFNSSPIKQSMKLYFYISWLLLSSWLYVYLFLWGILYSSLKLFLLLLLVGAFILSFIA